MDERPQDNVFAAFQGIVQSLSQYIKEHPDDDRINQLRHIVNLCEAVESIKDAYIAVKEILIYVSDSSNAPGSSSPCSSSSCGSSPSTPLYPSGPNLHTNDLLNNILEECLRAVEAVAVTIEPGSETALEHTEVEDHTPEQIAISDASRTEHMSQISRWLTSMVNISSAILQLTCICLSMWSEGPPAWLRPDKRNRPKKKNRERFKQMVDSDGHHFYDVYHFGNGFRVTRDTWPAFWLRLVAVFHALLSYALFVICETVWQSAAKEPWGRRLAFASNGWTEANQNGQVNCYEHISAGGPPLGEASLSVWQQLRQSLDHMTTRSTCFDKAFSEVFNEPSPRPSLNTTYSVQWLSALLSPIFDGLGKLPQQIQIAEALVQYAHDIGERQLMYVALQQLAHYSYLMHPEVPCKHLEQAAALANQMDAPSPIIHANARLSSCKRNKGMIEDARAHMNKSLSVHKLVEHQPNALEVDHHCTFLFELAMAEWDSPVLDWVKVENLLTLALNMSQANGLDLYTIGNSMHLALLHAKRQNWKLAEFYRSTAETYVTSPRHRIVYLLKWSELEFQKGFIGQARRIAKSVSSLARNHGYMKDARDADALLVQMASDQSSVGSAQCAVAEFTTRRFISYGACASSLCLLSFRIVPHYWSRSTSHFHTYLMSAIALWSTTEVSLTSCL